MSVCPCCGYCPACGRSNSPYYQYQYYPYCQQGQQLWPYGQSAVANTVGTNATGLGYQFSGGSLSDLQANAQG